MFAQLLRTLCLAALVALALTSNGQQKLTLSDAILKAGTELAPQRLKGLQWIKGADAYSYVKGEDLMRGEATDASAKAILSLATLNEALPDSTKLRGIPAVSWTAPNAFRFQHNGKFYAYNLDSRLMETQAVLLADASNEDVEENTGRVAFTVENDLFIAQPNSGKALRVTNDGADGIVNGQSVHRQEYGITKGTFWSPKGELLAFYRMDETMVSKYQLEDITTSPSTFKGIRYPMSGQTSHHVTVGVYDLRKQSTVFLKTGEPLDDYLTNISWSADERFVHVVHLDRKTENLRLVRYDAATGETVTTLHGEHDDRYLEPQRPAHFLRTRSSEFIWWSEADGWPHLYLHAPRKENITQLTSGQWAVKEVVGYDPQERFMVVAGTAVIDPAKPTGALETQLYRVDIPSGKTTRLTNEPGTHRGLLSSSGRYVLDQWSSTTVPGRIVVRDSRTGSVTATLLESTDPMKDRIVGSIELHTFRGENMEILNARLIKPSHFDPSKRYPVLIYVYNGPHVQLVSNSFLAGASAWMLEAAERGYLVWTVDGHGTPYRGREFERIIHRQLGIVEVKDQLRGVDFLKALPFVDGERIAVHGWSFGGHMTTAMLLRNPGVFKVGVAGGPVMDWSLYEVMYTERYMDTPAENPDGYAATALPAQAKELTEDLLLITGVQDDVVLPQHSLRFIQASVANGIQVDYFAYPGHGHNVRGKDRLHLMEKVLGYIDQKIMPTR
jgi:dipeptidyl-peptidase 4